MTFMRYIGVDFTFWLFDLYVFVITKISLYRGSLRSRFCSIHFTVTLAGLKNIVRYTEDFVRGSLNRDSTVYERGTFSVKNVL